MTVTKNKMELLAPAGTLEAFEVAIEQGADAVYFGVPHLNARALTKHFSMAEVAGMVAHAGKAGVKVFPAMNSLVREDDIPRVVEILAMLEEMRVDGVIIQDLGIYYLIRKYFPGLRMHASTLFAAHNSMAVRQFGQMGFDRVVLARELTLEEIGRIARTSSVDIEVFVHGALCFGFSGLCLFSSYLGGKSGLRGRCVQPCRRRYTWQGKGKGRSSGYFFSMNDLQGIELIPKLSDAGVVSLKIEGRMRSARYVGVVVKAYRKVLDAGPDDKDALAAACELLREAMGRKTTTGYFLNPQPSDAISPHHSGNTGLFLGKISKCRGKLASLVLKEPLRIGDRLRLHQERSGERDSFTLKKLNLGGKQADEAGKGVSVSMELPVSAGSGDSLYLVDTRERRAGNVRKVSVKSGRYRKMVKVPANRERVDQIIKNLFKDVAVVGKRGQRQRSTVRPRGGKLKSRTRRGRLPVSWWLRVDDLAALKKYQNMDVLPDRVVVTLDENTWSQFLKMRRQVAHLERNMIWALPPVIFDNDESFYRNAISRLLNSGFDKWQIGHIGQLQFFEPEARFGHRDARSGRVSRKCALKRSNGSGKQQKSRGAQKCVIIGDYSLNALNSQALRVLDEMGVSMCQVAVETDKGNLKDIFMHTTGAKAGLTVYGTIPLFTARLAGGHFQYGRIFVSPKEEEFVLKKSRDLTLALPRKPFSLLSRLSELAGMGLGYCVVDLCRMRLGRRDLDSLAGQLTGKNRERGLSSFNYNGHLK